MDRSLKIAAFALICASLVVLSSLSFAGVRTVYSDDGISELRAAEPWSVRPDIGRTAALRIADDGNDNYLIVNTYLREEIRPMPFAKFAEKVSAGLLDNLEDGKMSPAKKLTINGLNALEYEITGRIDGNQYAYLSTVVEGKNAWHHLLSWTLGERYQANSGALREIAAYFRESPKRRAAKERIELVFDWPGKAESKFFFNSKRTRRGVSNEIKMSGTTKMSALSKDELLVSTQVTDFQISPSEKDEAKNNYMQNLMQKLTSQIPDYVVNADGELVRFDNLDAYYGRIEQGMVEGFPGDAEEDRQKAKQLMKTLIPEAALAQSLRDEWNNHVGSWAGSSYATGETYTFAAQYQVAALGETAFPMTITQRLLGRVPCHQEDKGKHCVKLEQKSQVSDPSFSKAMHEMVSRTIKNMAGDKADEVNIGVDRAGLVKTVTLVTDPETLLPYELQTSKITTVVITEKGRTETTEDIDESTTRYVY